ncbi:tyrosine-type recombinase/integrase [Pseudoalteromonas agarivorans]|uniref:tyrosine-type recombinase/integrase n=1 Tax=Pseudoalteromonas agarivorans TaxID=176102 RepID=UPI00249CDC96|nr:site-specific integrase [Pseudoalteromonas agarivorans]MDI3246918.1 tyrosine-type recombinase/integrase [Pseudoalteromonas agarivorans]
MAISDTKLRKLLGKNQTPCVLSHRDSLSVRVSAKGTITWQYRCRVDAKQVIITLGRYPGLSIKEAQDYIPLFQNWLSQDKDPRLELKLMRNNAKGLPTMAEVAATWLDKKVPDLKEKTQILYTNQVSKWIVPILNDKNTPLDLMTIKDWITYFDEVKAQGSAKTAGTILVRIKSIIGWAEKRGEVKPFNPVLTLNVNDIGEQASVGQRVMRFDEIAKLWIQIESSKATPATKACLQLIYITGARQSEVRLAKWEHFDFENGIWTVPPENSKTNKAIRRPISTKMKSILDTLAMVYGRKGYLIPGGNPHKPMTTHSINRYCCRMWDHLFAKYKMPKFLPHDARRSLSTLLSENGIAPHVTEKMLGHTMRGVMAVYNKHDWIKEQAEGYELYCQLIEDAILESLNNKG